MGTGWLLLSNCNQYCHAAPRPVQPLPFERLFTTNSTNLFGRPEDDESRRWLILDEQGSVLRRQFLPY